jgi:hypothetical protein
MFSDNNTLINFQNLRNWTKVNDTIDSLKWTDHMLKLVLHIFQKEDSSNPVLCYRPNFWWGQSTRVQQNLIIVSASALLKLNCFWLEDNEKGTKADSVIC